jgi:hypothetical protein
VQKVCSPGVPDGAVGVIVISKTGVCAESAFNFCDKRRDFFSVTACYVMGDVVSREDDYIRLEQIYSVDASSKVFCADGSAAMEVADVDEFCSGQLRRRIRIWHVEIEKNDLEPFGAMRIGVDGPGGTETETAERFAFDEMRMLN